MKNFHRFAKLVNDQFMQLSKGELFTVDANKGDLWATYLAAFPPGTDPVYKVNTEHTCSCCRQFIHNIGGAVAITDTGVKTVWDVTGLEPTYQTVADAMRAEVQKRAVAGLFRPTEGKYGAEQTLQETDSGVVRWDHFFAVVQPAHKARRSAATDRGDYATLVGAVQRGLREIKPLAVTDVLELIAAGGLYRGAEHKPAVEAFAALQQKYVALPTDYLKNLFVWRHAKTFGAAIRNTVIGTLLTDLSDGMDSDAAIRSFEAKVAPTNYKHPTAAVTPSMVKAAAAKLAELGVEPALQRRFATAADLRVTNVLWVDTAAKALMQKSPMASLLDDVKAAPRGKERSGDVPIDEFMTRVLPQASSLEVFVGHQHQTNLVSLTTAVDPHAGQLFKWANPFAWSYNGNVTDSIKERVKSAGGAVDGALRVSLAWFNYDDLDLHVENSKGGHIYFGNRADFGGRLDVDMNAGGGKTRSPVENVDFHRMPQDGVYNVHVHQFSARETSDVGFTVEVACAGRSQMLSFPRRVPGGERVPVCTITIKAGVVVDIRPGKDIVGKGIEQEKWGITTETYVKANMVMFSPNFWDGVEVGNKHWFFMLDKCVNPDPARGVYNEFLSSALEPHRKVFEMLGERTKCPVAADQLSGLGFSSTKRDQVPVRVTTGQTTSIVNIVF